MTRVIPVCLASDLHPGGRRIIRVQELGSIGVFNVHGSFYALKNRCPHQGAPLCEGPISGTTVHIQRSGEMPRAEWVRDGEILRCPWHAWEFDIRTGKALCDDPWRVAAYKVALGGTAEDRDVAPGEAAVEVASFPVAEEDGMLYLVIDR